MSATSSNPGLDFSPKSTLPEIHADPKSTKTCCGATLEPFLASAQNKSGNTVYVTAYECPRCKKISL